MRRRRPAAGRKAADQILGLLYPQVCPFCGKVSGERICSACRKELRYIEEPRCMRCGKPLRIAEQEYCLDCEQRSHSYERGLSLWVHSGSVQSAVYQFKYHNRRIYSRFFAQELLERYEEAIRRWNIALIVPIPLSKKRRRERGFNQAELLAKEIGKKLEIPVESKRLVRVKNTKPQKEMDARGRRSNLKDAFAWKGERPIRGNILLIDDIYTTGNTIDHAAGTLKNAGARKVYFLTVSIGQGY